MRVLLAEDDLILQRGLKQTLRDAGHQAIVVSDGMHADTLLRTEPFDLVVLDLGLPRLDGIAVLERLRRRGQSTSVLILSARDRTEDRVRGLDTGADDYMCKPFDLAEFEARVRAFARRESASKNALSTSSDKPNGSTLEYRRSITSFRLVIGQGVS